MLILLKSTAAVVRISSLFWSYSLWDCYTETDQCPSVTSEGCWLCSPFVTRKFCDPRNGKFEECAREPCIFFFWVNMCDNVFLCLNSPLPFPCLEWISSLRICISDLSVSAVKLSEGQVSKAVCHLTSAGSVCGVVVCWSETFLAPGQQLDT